MINSFLDCMFLVMLQWQMLLYSRQIVNGCFLLPPPFFVLLCFSGDDDETQVWLGDLRVVLLCDVVLFVSFS